MLATLEATVAFGGGAFAVDRGLVADVLGAPSLLAVVEAAETFAFAPSGGPVALVGQAFAFIGEVLARVGFAFPLVGHVFALVGDRVTHPERVFAREQLRFPQLDLDHARLVPRSRKPRLSAREIRERGVVRTVRRDRPTFLHCPDGLPRRWARASLPCQRCHRNDETPPVAARADEKPRAAGGSVGRHGVAGR